MTRQQDQPHDPAKAAAATEALLRQQVELLQRMLRMSDQQAQEARQLQLAPAAIPCVDADTRLRRLRQALPQLNEEQRIALALNHVRDTLSLDRVQIEEVLFAAWWKAPDRDVFDQELQLIGAILPARSQRLLNRVRKKVADRLANEQLPRLQVITWSAEMLEELRRDNPDQAVEPPAEEVTKTANQILEELIRLKGKGSERVFGAVTVEDTTLWVSCTKAILRGEWKIPGLNPKTAPQHRLDRAATALFNDCRKHGCKTAQQAIQRLQECVHGVGGPNADPNVIYLNWRGEPFYGDGTPAEWDEAAATGYSAEVVDPGQEVKFSAPDAKYVQHPGESETAYRQRMLCELGPDWQQILHEKELRRNYVVSDVGRRVEVSEVAMPGYRRSLSGLSSLFRGLDVMTVLKEVRRAEKVKNGQNGSDNRSQSEHDDGQQASGDDPEGRRSSGGDPEPQGGRDGRAERVEPMGDAKRREGGPDPVGDRRGGSRPGATARGEVPPSADDAVPGVAGKARGRGRRGSRSAPEGAAGGVQAAPTGDGGEGPGGMGSAAAEGTGARGRGTGAAQPADPWAE